jgi:MFS family permease
MRHEHSLDALNFFLADVRQGLGPYLTIYLLTERHWAEDQIGFVMTIATVCGLIAQTPAGALTDASHAKRAIIAAAALVVTGASTLLPFMSSFVFVAGSQAAADAAAAFFGPAIAAITLGIMGPRAFTRRIGRNESFNHAGNAFAAALAGVCAWMWGPIVVFYLIASMALLSIVSVLTIRPDAIDYDLARGLHIGPSESQEKPSGLSVLMGSGGLLTFCLCCVIFHLANAAMLPLVGQKLALQTRTKAPLSWRAVSSRRRSSWCRWPFSLAERPIFGDESPYFSPDWPSCLCAVFSTHYRTIACGCSRSKVSMASARGFMARSFRSSSRI